MKKTIKRVLSMVIAFTMLTALIPSMLFAEELDAHDSVPHYDIADAPSITDNNEDFIYNDIALHTDTIALTEDVQGAANDDIPPAFTLSGGHEKVLHLRDLNLQEGHDFDANPIQGLIPEQNPDTIAIVNDYGGINITTTTPHSSGGINIEPTISRYATNPVDIKTGDVLRVRVRNTGVSETVIFVSPRTNSHWEPRLTTYATVAVGEIHDFAIIITQAHLNAIHNSGVYASFFIYSTSETWEIADILIERDPAFEAIKELMFEAQELLFTTAISRFGWELPASHYWTTMEIRSPLDSVTGNAQIAERAGFSSSDYYDWHGTPESIFLDLQREIEIFKTVRQQGYQSPLITAFTLGADRESVLHLRGLNLQEGHNLNTNPIRGLAPVIEVETDVRVNKHGGIAIVVPYGEQREHWGGLDIIPFVEGDTPEENFEIMPGDVLRIRVHDTSDSSSWYFTNEITVEAGSDSEHGMLMGSVSVPLNQQRDIIITITQAHLDAAKNDNSEHAHNNFRIRSSAIGTPWEIGDILIERDPRIPIATAAGNAAREAVLALIPQAPLPHNYSMTQAEEFKNAINDLSLEHPLIDISSSFSISGTSADNRRLNVLIEFTVSSTMSLGERAPIIPPINTTIAIVAEGTPQPTPTTPPQPTPTAPPQPTPTAPTTITVTQGFARPSETTQVGIRLDRNPGFAGMFLRVELPEGLTLVSYEVTDPELANGISMAQVGGNVNIAPNETANITGAFFIGWVRDTDFTAQTGILMLNLAVDFNAENGNLPINVTLANATGDNIPTNADGETLDVTVRQGGGVTVRTEIKNADANGDNRITSADGVIIARYIVGHVVTIDKEAADLNGDGKVNTLDLTILGRWLVGIESPPNN